jgi:hypothetical protein
MLEIFQAKQIKDYKIEIIFNNNKKGIVDLKDIIFTDHREIFKELKDFGLFT